SEFPTVTPKPRTKGSAQNFPYESVNVEWSHSRRFGFVRSFHCMSYEPSSEGAPRPFGTALGSSRRLLGIQLDDELLLDILGDILSEGHPDDGATEIHQVRFQPGRHGMMRWPAAFDGETEWLTPFA